MVIRKPTPSVFALLALLALVLPALAPWVTSRALAANDAAKDALAIFDEASALLMPPNADPRFKIERDSLRSQLGARPTLGMSRLALRQLQRELGGAALEAQLLSSEEQKYWVDASCFGGELNAYPLAHIGAWFERRGRRWFVHTVLAGGPAADAGLIRGDELLTANGKPFAPVSSFRGLKSGTQVQLSVRRMPWEAPRSMPVKVTVSSMAEALKRHQALGTFVRQVGDKQIMYVPLPLTCHRSMETALESLATKAQAQVDAMVVDLRGDFADGGLTFAAPFIGLPTNRDTAASPLALAPFAKRLVLIVDSGTRGGREQLAAFLSQRKRASLVGTATAGATRAGRAVTLGDSEVLLWLPRGEVAGAQLLPDVTVDSALVYAAGSDDALDRALTEAARADRPGI